jgi:hypothetical protein
MLWLAVASDPLTAAVVSLGGDRKHRHLVALGSLCRGIKWHGALQPSRTPTTAGHASTDRAPLCVKRKFQRRRARALTCSCAESPACCTATYCWDHGRRAFPAHARNKETCRRRHIGASPRVVYQRPWAALGRGWNCGGTRAIPPWKDQLEACIHDHTSRTIHFYKQRPRFAHALSFLPAMLLPAPVYVFALTPRLPHHMLLPSPAGPQRPATTFRTPPSTAMISPLTYVFFAKKSTAWAISSSCPARP